MTCRDVTSATPIGTLVAHRSADRPGVAPIVEHAGVLDGLDAVVVGLTAVHYCRDLVVVEVGPEAPSTLDSATRALRAVGLPAEVVWHGPGAAFVECPLPDGRHLAVDDYGWPIGTGTLGVCVYSGTAARRDGDEPTACTMSDLTTADVVRIAVALRDGVGDTSPMEATR